MESRWLIVFISLIYFGHTFDFEDDGSDEIYDFNSSSEDTNDYSSPEEPKDKKTPILKPTSRYEVTEIVDDIPNNTTLGPIIANYSILRPIHIISANAPNSEANINILDNTTTTKVNNTLNLKENLNGKKNSINILHINAEYDDKPFTPRVPVLKDYINEVKEGIAKGFSSIFQRKRQDDADTNSLLSIINRKSSEIASKVHKALFGDKFSKK